MPERLESDSPTSSRTVTKRSASETAVADVEHRRAWYARYASRALWAYRTFTVLQLASAASVPVAAAAGAESWITATLGSLVAVLTGAQQVLGLGPDVVRLSTTSVGIDRELRLYRAQAGPYVNMPGAAQLLSERVEDIVAADTTRWASRREQAEWVDKPEQAPG